MSKIMRGIKFQIITFRWIILLILLLFQVKWNQDYYSIGYFLLISFNSVFSFFYFKKVKSGIWEITILMEILSLLLLNSLVLFEIVQLFYLFTSFLLIGIFLPRRLSIFITLTYSLVAFITSYVEKPQQLSFVEMAHPFYFIWAFTFYLLLSLLMKNSFLFIKKWIVLLHYIEKLSRHYSMKVLHRITEGYVRKLLGISKCHICLYANYMFIDDWYNQYYTRLLLSDSSNRFERNRKVVMIDNYHGNQERYIVFPIRARNLSENAGGLLIPIEKTKRYTSLDFLLLRILLSSFLNQLYLSFQEQAMANTTKDEVRSQIAQDMHDGLAQQLFFLSAQIYQMKSHLKNGQMNQLENLIQAMEQQASSCQLEVRTFIGHLKGERRESNIYDALHQLIERLSFNTPVKIKLELSGNVTAELVEIEEAVYRLIEESINNILKHAEASQITIMVEITLVQWTIKIIDDGNGFDITEEQRKTPSYGLTGLRQRVENLGGNISIRSKLGKGTEIAAIIPREEVRKYVQSNDCR
jgi:signal transduction histidine kinase